MLVFCFIFEFLQNESRPELGCGERHFLVLLPEPMQHHLVDLLVVLDYDL